jgi:hypothetical protein
MKGRLAGPLHPQLLLDLLQALPSLALKVLGPNIGRVVSPRIEPVSVVARQWQSHQPLHPCQRTPSVPQSRPHIVRHPVPHLHMVSTILIRLLRKHIATHQVRPRESKIPQVQPPDHHRSVKHRFDHPRRRIIPTSRASSASASASSSLSRRE